MNDFVPCGRRFEYFENYEGPLTAWCHKTRLCPHCERIQQLEKQYERAYAEGESSGYADWSGALGEVMPEGSELLPSSVAAFVQQLEQEKEDLQHAFDVVNEDHKWLYALWMAFLAEEETHELQYVLKNMSAWMWERQEEKDD